jgi:peptide/nickel transport system substrate-binding protein
MVPPAMWGHDDSLVDHTFDPDRAKQLLQEAAAEGDFQLPLKLDLSVMAQARPYLPLPAAIAGFLKDSLREIGIQAEINPRPVNEHFDALMAGKHELGLAGWNSDNSDPDNFLYSLLDLDNISPPGTAAGNNLSRWRHDRFHELLLAGQRESDEAKRLAIYKEAQQIVLDEMPVVPLAHTNLRAAHSKRLKGYALHPTGLVRLREAYFEAAP